MLQGVNHITIAVGNLAESFDFYANLLGMTPHAKWSKGAYLSLNGLWICLSVDTVKPNDDYSHLAFDVSASNFSSLSKKLLDHGVQLWKENKSEGDSLYFLDPNGYKLELHVGGLEERLASLKIAPYDDLTLY